MLTGEHLTIGDTEYEVVFNARARYVFEDLAGYPVTALRAWRDERVSDREVAWLLAAGLEGARVRSRSRRKPWTVDEVIDNVLGDAEPADILGALAACVRAVNNAFAGLDADPEEGPQETGKATPAG